MKSSNFFLMLYGSVVSSTWLWVYKSTDSSWGIVQLDGLVHLICGAVVAMVILCIPQLKRLEVVAVLVLVLFFWEILERGMFYHDWQISNYYLMDTISDIMLGAIGGLMIIFDGDRA